MKKYRVQLEIKDIEEIRILITSNTDKIRDFITRNMNTIILSETESVKIKIEKLKK